jgi:hypothetical protein
MGCRLPVTMLFGVAWLLVTVCALHNRGEQKCTKRHCVRTPQPRRAKVYKNRFTRDNPDRHALCFLLEFGRHKECVMHMFLQGHLPKTRVPCPIRSSVSTGRGQCTSRSSYFAISNFRSLNASKNTELVWSSKFGACDRGAYLANACSEA